MRKETVQQQAMAAAAAAAVGRAGVVQLEDGAGVCFVVRKPYDTIDRSNFSGGDGARRRGERRDAPELGAPAVRLALSEDDQVGPSPLLPPPQPA